MDPVLDVCVREPSHMDLVLDVCVCASEPIMDPVLVVYVREPSHIDVCVRESPHGLSA